MTRSFSPGDIQQVLSLLDSSLGEGYVSAEGLARYAESGSEVSQVSEDSDGNINGAMTGQVLLPGISLSSIVHQTHAERLGKLVPESVFSRMGLLKSGAVSSEARGTGLGTLLAGEVTDKLFRSGASCVLALAWIDEDGCHAEGMLNRLGFQKRGDIKELWKQDSVEEGYSCPSCGNPCRCTGRVFVHFRHRWAYNTAK